MTKTIEITYKTPYADYGKPVCLIDGKVVDPGEGIRAVMDRLGWTADEFAKRTNKGLRTVGYYRAGEVDIPAEVWLVLKDELERRESDGWV